MGNSVDKSMVDDYNIYIDLISSVFDNFSFLDQLYSNIVDEIEDSIESAICNLDTTSEKE